MNDPLSLAGALSMGFLLGVFFFGGLWWTIRRGMASNQAALWFLGSMLLRTAGVLLGFYFVSADDWHKLLACLLGFVIARFVIARRVRRAQQPQSLALAEDRQINQETDHAP
ncbi:MAG: ATPase F0F1 [Halothiobacillus sp. 24-54-40]|jgi:F1F0 ATPase subunit 2|nr:MAG: ATPase F0F1 [Halothiobacillus sp. 20-53-49]OYY41468.1 MAG: ATPase F0F1 [Halothiobacillus sp. 35-54-62]OYZ87725.1 MAG: ATPase F0F1 [Halothiobacillus sp. 24-54-40]OZA81507.1 MAG: ATPase F0F1 [Halothiobacillus sp. 39-53-45]HQS02790.1 ATP synthase subunit I [Halothiobacillus sp.]